MHNRHLITGGRLAAGFLLIALFAVYFYSSTPTVAQEVVIPEEVADAERGLLLFETRCAACHGATGGGDGEMAPDSIQPPTVFADPAFRLTAVPADMFDTIVNGRIERGMPPYGSVTNSNPLSDQDVWDLIAAIYSFSTPGASVQQGRELFATEIDMEGDFELTNLALWATQSNETIVEQFRSEGVLVNPELAEDEVLAIVDFARGMMSYTYAEPGGSEEPIETAVINGEVTNGTTGGVAGGFEASVRAFTQDLQEVYTESVMVGEDGRFSFTLENIPPDWIFLVSTNYEGFQFSSAPARLDRETPEVEMLVKVYDTTNSADMINIEQVHSIFNFAGDVLQVTQFYRYNNVGNTLFVGTAGEAESGTVEIMLPTGAQAVTFERGFGSMDSFIPATEIIETEAGWADTLPLRPGAGVMDLLINYNLPFEDGMLFTHPLPYPVARGTLIFPDVGVALEAEGWQLQGQDEMGGTSFLSYTNNDLAASDSFTMILNGEPEVVMDTQGNVLQPRNENNELIIGGASLLIVVGAAVYLFQTWRNPSAAIGDDPEELLEMIVELDEAFENGEIDRSEYEAERAELKEALLDVWVE
ncbi:MAG: hypothetical protein DWQ04_01430 [Chloroflexi bacterium]|nr:MAG: hypothetical protein DWQ04_01430 [Chloroflexota bacterium]